MKEINRVSLYDLRTRRVMRDIDPIRQLIKGSQYILEVGSGTGRILRHLAEAKNTTFVGVEVDPLMYEIGQQNCKVYKNVELIKSDFLQYKTDRKFDCILFSFNVLAEFLDVSSRFEALRKAKELLSTMGKIIIINELLSFADMSKMNVKYKFIIGDKSSGKWECAIDCSRDLIQQISRCRVTYSQIGGERLEVLDEYSNALLTRNELLTLYIGSGLKVDKKYGSYELGTLDTDSEVDIHVLSPMEK